MRSGAEGHAPSLVEKMVSDVGSVTNVREGAFNDDVAVWCRRKCLTKAGVKVNPAIWALFRHERGGDGWGMGLQYLRGMVLSD